MKEEIANNVSGFPKSKQVILTPKCLFQVHFDKNHNLWYMTRCLLHFFFLINTSVFLIVVTVFRYNLYYKRRLKTFVYYFPVFQYISVILSTER